MPFPRASSGMLRSHIRPAGPRASPLRRHAQTRGIKDDLGGPGGQKPAPQKPGGPEAIQRNWLPAMAAALTVVAAFAYLSKPGPSQRVEDTVKQVKSEMKNI